MRWFIKLLRRRKEGPTLEEKRKILRAVVEDNDLYDVATALRGPDLKCKWDVDLKEMYTMPIRAIALQSALADPIEIVLTRITPERLEGVLLALKDVEGKVVHFINHAAFAFRAFYDLLLIPEDVYYYILDTIDAIVQTAQMGGEITESVRELFSKVKETYYKLREKYMGEGSQP